MSSNKETVPNIIPPTYSNNVELGQTVIENTMQNELLTFLAQTSSMTLDEPFLNKLARYLAQCLDMDFVCIDRLEGDGLTATTVAVWCDGHFEDNVSYALKDTPCGDAVGQTVCCFPALVCQMFPNDQVLLDLKAESYVGVTLWSHTGEPIGLIAVISRQPLANRKLAESIMQIVAVRAAGEIERLEAEKALLESEKELEEAQFLAGTGSWTYDPVTQKAIWSKGMFHIWGLDPSIGLFPLADHQKYIHPEDYPRFEAALKEALENGIPYKEELRLIRPDGMEKNIITICKPIVDASGKVIKLRGSNQDITERKQIENELRDNMEDLRESQRIAHVGSWRMDSASNEVVWSEELYRMYGFDPNLPPPPYTEHKKLFTPESWERLSAALQNTQKTGIPYSLELEMKRGDGCPGWMWSYGMAVLDEKGVTVGLRGVAQDITEHKLKDENLEKMKNILSESQKIAHMGTFEYVADTHTTLWSEGEYIIYGLNPAEPSPAYEVMLTKNIHPDDAALLQQTFSTAIQNGSTYDLVHRIVRPDGSVRWVHDRANPYFDQNGKLIRYVGSTLDITDRKQFEDQLHQSYEQLQFVLDGSQLGFWDWNLETGEVVRNERWAEMLGYSLNEIDFSTNQWTDLIHPDDREQAWRSINDHLEGRTPLHEFEYRMLGKDGQYKWILDRAKIVQRDTKGRPVRMSGTHTDISARKKVEEENQVFEHQLQHTQKLESLGILSGGIAHDFNNILAIIIGYCGLIKMDYETAEENIQEIEKAAERAAGLCRQMLAYAGKAQLTMSQINMFMLVNEMVTMLKTTLPLNAEIDPVLSTDVPLIKGDSSQIRQIIMNLIINASEAIGNRHGKIRVSLATTTIRSGQSELDYNGNTIPSGEYVCLEVTDNGCGMDEETKWRIFEPFFTTKFTGRGLGMSAVLGIIKSHGGALQLHSQLGQGTTFKVYLPVQKTASDNGENTSVFVPSAPWMGSGTILLVEDEDQVRLIAKALLKSIGFTVLEAANGKEALELYQRNATDITLVVTDMGMPIMNGYELLSELKNLNPELPVIVSSGYGDAEVTSRIDTDNIAGLISKPYGPDQLREVLKRALEGVK